MMSGSGKTKDKPVLKVVQIFNPTVITTDVGRFRELVQELTGRNYQPTARPRRRASRKTSTTSAAAKSRNYSSSRFQSGVMTAAAQRSPAGSASPGFCFPSSPNWSSDKSEDFGSSSGGSHNSAGGASSFEEDMEVDIISALMSSESLPDCTMLPPLIY